MHSSNTDALTAQAKTDLRARKVAAINGQQTQRAAMSQERIKSGLCSIVGSRRDRVPWRDVHQAQNLHSYAPPLRRGDG